MNTKHSALETQSPVARLRQYGQSVWLDSISRKLIDSGELGRMVKQDGLGGVTSNPSIFQQAIEGSGDYAPEIKRLSRDGQLRPPQIFEQLAVKDIRDAAQIFGPAYRDTQGGDGYVSLEVAPDLAQDTRGSVEAARRLWRELDRPNVMIKVPGTTEGLPAVAQLLGEGVNVNITLLFARSTYEQVAEIYLQALEQRAARGQPIERVASVASFFVSRIDSAVDQLISGQLEQRSGAERSQLQALKGKAAIANAKLAYQIYRRLFSGPRWEALKAKGARPQRVLWASTGTKNPEYSDVLYVEELIGPDTVNTMPEQTLAAFRDHGRPRPLLENGIEEAQQLLARLERFGISLERVTDELLKDGVRKFAQPYQQLLDSLARQLPAAPAHG